MEQAGLRITVLIFHLPLFCLAAENSCYDSSGRAIECMPDFVNAAFNQTVEASNTCGLTGPQVYCLETGVTGSRKSCDHMCDAGTPSLMHPPGYITDVDSSFDSTWWQSESLEWLGSSQHQVNLTLTLGKSFDVTYIRLKFHSPRPESFAIYKRTSDDDEWEPYQFFSASCDRTSSFLVPSSKNHITATCTDEYSDISPLTGGRVSFSTLEGRYGVENFDDSELLQDWVTATDIKVVLTRMNTFGDEIFGEPDVLRSYFYAIDDIAIGARCKCNGHASNCEEGQTGELVCTCQHNTAGQDCNRCKPLYNDQPWARATDEDAKECKACDCNGMSDTCYFDEALYQETGHGGHCTNCHDNRAGIHCEKCLPNHYLDQKTNRCAACSCDSTGSEDIKCNEEGQCTCKPGVTGQRCNRCDDNFFNFGISGCRRKIAMIEKVLFESATRSEKEEAIDAWSDILDFSFKDHQGEFQKLYSELLEQNNNMTEDGARKRAYMHLLPTYRETVTNTYLFVMRWIEAANNDPVHRSIRRTAKRLREEDDDLEAHDALALAISKRKTLINKMLLKRAPHLI